LDRICAMSPGSDQLSIDTPELVTIEMPLAGIGSRFIAVAVDTILWVVALVALGFIFAFFLPAIAAFNKISYQWTVAIVIFLVFLFNWGYFTLFEAFWNGRTPGKKIAKIRVIQQSGRPIGLLESMARNLVRYVDAFPSFYAVGVITMFVTKQHQRLGDLAAGTLVVQDREQEAPLWGETGSRTFTAASFMPQVATREPHLEVSLPAMGIAKLTGADLEVLEGFFARRLDMPLEIRQKLAERIAGAIAAKSEMEIPSGVSTETFLEAAARELRDAARMR
jgi:uncharacterized RDD family membrane protein YckC